MFCEFMINSAEFRSSSDLKNSQNIRNLVSYTFRLLARPGSQLANTLKLFYFILQKSKGKRIIAKVFKSRYSIMKGRGQGNHANNALPPQSRIGKGEEGVKSLEKN